MADDRTENAGQTRKVPGLETVRSFAGKLGSEAGNSSEMLDKAQETTSKVTSRAAHTASIFMELMKTHRLKPGEVYYQKSKHQELSEESKPDLIYAVRNDGVLLVNQRQEPPENAPNANIWSGWTAASEAETGNRMVASELRKAVIEGGKENKGVKFEKFSEDQRVKFNVDLPPYSEKNKKLGPNNLKAAASAFVDQQPELAFGTSGMVIGSLVENVGRSLEGVPLVGNLIKMVGVPISLAGMLVVAHAIINKAINAVKLSKLPEEERAAIQTGQDGFLVLPEGIKEADHKVRELKEDFMEARDEHGIVGALKNMVSNIRPVSAQELGVDSSRSL